MIDAVRKYLKRNADHLSFLATGLLFAGMAGIFLDSTVATALISFGVAGFVKDLQRGRKQ